MRSMPTRKYAQSNHTVCNTNEYRALPISIISPIISPTVNKKFISYQRERKVQHDKNAKYRRLSLFEDTPLAVLEIVKLQMFPLFH
jgi:hypothetical protein